MNTSLTSAAIILAAGSSSRMGEGRHKLLLPLAGRPVLAYVIEAALASQALPIIVVLGHQASDVRAQIAPYVTQPGVIIVENPGYMQGMSTSMRVGLESLMSRDIPKVGSALIMLGDQPFITSHIIDQLIIAWNTMGKRIIAPLYDGKRGSPVLFEASLFAELLEVSGDEGGRSVLERHRDEVAMVEMGDAMANYDMDTWEAYQRVLEAWESKNEFRT